MMMRSATKDNQDLYSIQPHKTLLIGLTILINVSLTFLSTQRATDIFEVISVGFFFDSKWQELNHMDSWTDAVNISITFLEYSTIYPL